MKSRNALLQRATFVVLAAMTLACTEQPDDGADSGEPGDTGMGTDAGTGTDTGTDTGEADTADDSASCELWEGDATYPGDCACASPGEECVQNCFVPDDIKTCAEACAEIGESCVENACDGGTYTEGPSGCPAPSEYGQAVPFACDQPVPAGEPMEDFEFSVACCCTRS